MKNHFPTLLHVSVARLWDGVTLILMWDVLLMCFVCWLRNKAVSANDLAE